MEKVKDIITIVAVLAVFIGLPYLFGSGWLMLISWLPALFVGWFVSDLLGEPTKES